MASTLSKGTAFRGPNGQVAVRTGPAVAVGQYFVFDPDNGGYYENADDKVAEIEAWDELDVKASTASTTTTTPTPAPPAAPTPPATPTPAAAAAPPLPPRPPTAPAAPSGK